jgi:hypothetical protein
VASFFTALPLSGHFSLTGPAIALTKVTKLRQPNRVPSHFIDFDFIVLVLIFVVPICVGLNATRRFLWRQYQYKPFFVAKY